MKALHSECDKHIDWRRRDDVWDGILITFFFLNLVTDMTIADGKGSLFGAGGSETFRHADSGQKEAQNNGGARVVQEYVVGLARMHNRKPMQSHVNYSTESLGASTVRIDQSTNRSGI